MNFLSILFFAASLPTVDPLPADDVVLKAMVDELERSAKELVLPDLPRPYFVHMTAQDRRLFNMSAAYGGLQRSSESRNRAAGVRVRVGSYTLDNTNFRRTFGAAATIPIDDDYTALRQSLWLLLDQDYKQAVETLAQKIAYLKDKAADEDRPDDYSPAAGTLHFDPKPAINFDRAAWEKTLVKLSDRFKAHPKIQDADVSLFAGEAVEWIVTTEGTRVRMGDTGIQIQIQADLQADDGMPLADSRTYVAERIEQLPSVEKMLADIDEMCANLVALAAAPRLEQYSGPVLFDAAAAGVVFESLLGDRLSARPLPLGSSGDDPSFEKKIGLRILPRSFHITDDPIPKMFGETVLTGAYELDDEAVKPSKTKLVKKGILKTLVSGRAPTRKIKQSTGHARNVSFGDPRANIGCLYISSDDAMTSDELTKELLQAAQDEGLEAGLRVKALERGSSDELGDPIYAYRVSAKDGKEELVRGLRFRPVQATAMKRILGAGNEPKAYNSVTGISASIIAPPVLFEELELSKIEGEFETLPILKSPATR